VSGSTFFTFFYQVVPFDCPRFQLFGVHLFDLGAFRDQRHQVVAKLVPVLDPLRRSLVVARLPERVRAGGESVLTVMRHVAVCVCHFNKKSFIFIFTT